MISWCMPQANTVIVLTPEERAGLETLARTGRGRADLARRARIVLRLAAGASYAEIVQGLGESTRSIAKWKQRFLEARIAGLDGRYRKDRADSGPRSAHPGLDPEAAGQWRHPVEYADVGGRAQTQQPHLRPAGVETRRVATPSHRTVHAVDRSRL